MFVAKGLRAQSDAVLEREKRRLEQRQSGPPMFSMMRNEGQFTRHTWLRPGEVSQESHVHPAANSQSAPEITVSPTIPAAPVAEPVQDVPEPAEDATVRPAVDLTFLTAERQRELVPVDRGGKKDQSRAATTEPPDHAARTRPGSQQRADERQDEGDSLSEALRVPARAGPEPDRGKETPGVVYEVYHTAEPPDDLVTDDILGYTKAYAKRIHAGAQHDDPEAKQIARITMALIYAQGLAEQSGENIETELHRLRDRVP
jgi:hypothetical protein